MKNGLPSVSACTVHEADAGAGHAERRDQLADRDLVEAARAEPLEALVAPQVGEQLGQRMAASSSASR